MAGRPADVREKILTILEQQADNKTGGWVDRHDLSAMVYGYRDIASVRAISCVLWRIRKKTPGVIETSRYRVKLASPQKVAGA
jgi:hypothetical protein